MANGSFESAYNAARLSLIRSSKVWATYKSSTLVQKAETELAESEQEHSIGNLSTQLSTLNLAEEITVSQIGTNSAQFWKHIHLHFRGLLMMFDLSVHAGIYQDAQYFAKEMAKVAIATNSRVFQMLANAALQTVNATDVKFDTTEADHLSLLDNLWILRNAIRASLRDGDYVAAQQHLGDSWTVLDNLQRAEGFRAQLSNLEHPYPQRSIVSRPKKPTPAECSAQKETGRALATSKVIEPKEKGKARLIDRSILSINHSIIVLELCAQNLAQEIKVHLSQENVERACKSVQRIKDRFSTINANVVFRHLEAELDIQRARQSFSDDAIRCVLAETAISLPASVWNRKCIPADSITGPKVKPPRKVTSKLVHTGPEITSLLLERARNAILTCQPKTLRIESSSDVAHFAALLYQSSMLSSVLLQDMKISSECLWAQWNACLAIPNRRERIVLATERTMRARLGGRELATSLIDHGFNMSDMSDLLSIKARIPSQWNVIDLRLSLDCKELLISKLTAQKEPFLIRLPLNRNSENDFQGEPLTFDLAREELRTLIKKANATAHDARSFAEGSVRKLWWSERKSLDRTLQVLLDDIEHQWLGGFKAVFENTKLEEAALTDFITTFTKRLDAYLPSRQRLQGPSRAQSHIHPYILELFLQLGDADNEDLDDSIFDLLYFVIDVLQSRGEHNAYDEIDFDMFLVDIQAAIRRYRNRHGLEMAGETNHTILILDKQLQAFPWESLPCLRGKSVSRLQSLLDLTSRIPIATNDSDVPQALTISAVSGSYVLNPSTDLIATQKNFGEIFATHIPSFEGIVGRAPTEAEMVTAIDDKDIFLYFGHGSGAQYIRSRKIRCMQNSAVTFLMGCSSSKMIECGQFENYGVPLDYLHSGTPAVVGTLWDVTDKDIDRFAMKSFENWGLIRKEEVFSGATASKTPKKLRARIKKMENKPAFHARTLTQAVAEARESCMLRYLNGAAPVVHGVPVILG